MFSGTPQHRVAVVGTGGIAGVHAQALTGLGDLVTMVGAVDVDERRAADFARSWRIPHSAGSLDQLLTRIRPDTAHICSPPDSHAALAAQCLRAGIVPLIEKPPALSLAEMAQLRSAELACDIKVACVFQHRFGPAAVLLRELVGSGRLGRPLVAAAHTYWYRDDDYFAVPWRGTWATEGGGPTMGHGIHQFDLLLAVLGPWAEVTGIAGRQARPTETEDVSMALVRFGSGAMATVVNSVVSPRQTSSLRFDFEHATVEVNHLYGYTWDDWTFTASPGHEELAGLWQEAATGAEPSGHEDQFRAVYGALATGGAPPVSLASATVTMEFIAALYASAFTGQTVRSGDLTDVSPYAHRMGGGLTAWAGKENA
jgi:predicted dehydrogenase